MDAEHAKMDRAVLSPTPPPKPVTIRFSIAGLMAVVLLLGVGFAGLRTASFLWASAVFTLTVTLLAAATLGAVACRGPFRMAWLGFGVFGWTYLLATFWLWPAPNGVSAPPFLTKALLDALQPSPGTGAVMTIDAFPQGEMSTEPPPMVGALRPARFAGRVVNLLHYRRIGHTLAAIVLGLLGALLGMLFSARSQAAKASENGS